MVTNIPGNIALPLVAGAGLGLFYFGGLWLTVRSLPASRHPALLGASSFLLRGALTLAALYLVMDGQPMRLLACLAGFLILRFLLLRRFSPRPPAAVLPLHTGAEHGDQS